MPVPVLAQPGFDTVNNVLTAASVSLGEDVTTLAGVSGGVQGLGTYTVLQSLNDGWRKFQEMLVSRGYSGLTSMVVIPSIPAVASTDPAVNCWISWSGCSDGVSTFSSPALPADFTHPLKAWERVSGRNACFPDRPMEKMLDGLVSTRKGNAIGQWEWRGDALWYPGSQLVEDIQIRYARFLADFADTATVQWFNAPVPLMRCSHALALYLCAEISAAREQLDLAENFAQRGEAAASGMFNRDVRADERVNIRRQPRSGRGGRSWY